MRYAVPALVNASSASESVGNIRKICSTRVISKTLSTRLFTPVRAMRRPALVQVVQALASNKVQLVPQIIAGGGSGGHGGTLVDVLLANLIRDQMKADGNAGGAPSAA